MKSINIVLSKPHHGLIVDSKVCKYQSLKNTSMDTIKWLEKRPHLLKNINGRLIPTVALQVTKKVSLDTKENRFLKFMLLKINALLRKRYKRVSSDFITINRAGIFVSLKKGITSTLVYENPKTRV